MADEYQPAPDPAALSLLDGIEALREQREAQTTTDLPLPGFQGRVWATFRLPPVERVTQVQALSAAGHPGLLSASLDLIARSTAGLYLADEGVEAPIRGETGDLREGFHHLPGGSDMMPMTFDTRLEAVTKLCPPRPGGRMHTPETRVRTLFAGDGLVTLAATMICGWSLGGADTPGALDGLSERFVGESKGGPM